MNTLFSSLEIPTINIGNRVGSTQYIDFIKKDDMNGYPLVKGIDIYSRPFIVVTVLMKKKVKDDKGKFKYIEQKYSQTFFQRYNGGKGWIGANGGGYREFINTCGYLDEHQINFLKELITQKRSFLEYKFRPIIILKEEKEEIFLYSLKHSVSTIEKNWLIFRYNPEWKLCEKILFKNIEKAEQEYNNF